MLTRFALGCMLFATFAFSQSTGDPAVVYARRTIIGMKTNAPAAGFIPDSETAVAIATAVLAPIYSKATIEAEKPWHAGLQNGIWTVVGTFNGKGEGGSAIIQLDKKTGRVIFVTHTM